jgi:hypothetical protein
VKAGLWADTGSTPASPGRFESLPLHSTKKEIMTGTIALIIIISIIAFVIGLAAMARYKQEKPKPIEKTPTKYTLYADHIINAATQIYCNYNESKIIRPGSSPQLKKDRYGEALQEALNLVGAAYHYFDLMDSDEKPAVQKPDLKNIKLN